MEDKCPLVSIVLPVYNGEKYVRKAIDSILAQTYRSIELVIVDDCSTDRTPVILQEYALMDRRIRIYRNEKNRKLPASLNVGFQHCRGRYYTWTSDDNLYAPEAIKLMVEAIEKYKCGIILTDYYFINEWDEIIKKSNFRHYQMEDILHANIIGACFLYKKEVHEKLCGYREDYYLVEDYDFWLRAYKKGIDFGFVDAFPYQYRDHCQSLTGSKTYKISKMIIKLLKTNVSFAKDSETKGKVYKALAHHCYITGNERMRQWYLLRERICRQLGKKE